MSRSEFNEEVNDGRKGPPTDATDRQDVPSELKAIEARLATLAPRADRLQRERLFFLAGQASVRDAMGHQKAIVPRWAWPTSLAAMTTVAATLFVMLLAQPEPAVIERIVYVPTQPAPANAPNETDFVPGAGQRDDVEDMRAASDGDAIAYALSTTHPPLRQRIPTAGPQFRLFDHLLAEASRVQMNQGMSPGGYDDPVSRPVFSRRLLNELLEESKAADSPSDWPASQNPGAKT